DAVRPCEALREEADQQRGRKTDHVQVVALDALDEARAQALDRVRARAALPLAARDIHRDVARGQRTEGDASDLVAKLLPARRDQTEPRDDLVRVAAERVEHLGRLFGAARLAVQATPADDGRVDPEHRAIARLAGDGARL